MTKMLAFAVLAVLLCCRVALGDDPVAPPGPPGDTMPSWVFYSTIALGTFLSTAAGETIRRLYNRATEVERQMLIRYEGDPENPAKPGILPTLRTLHQAERVEMRAVCTAEKATLVELANSWRAKYEDSEVSRREDSERFRLSELENLRAGMATLQDVGTALKANTGELRSLIVEIHQSRSDD